MFSNKLRSVIDCCKVKSVWWMVKMLTSCTTAANCSQNIQWQVFLLLPSWAMPPLTHCRAIQAFILSTLMQQLPLLPHPRPRTDVTHTQHWGHNTDFLHRLLKSGKTMTDTFWHLKNLNSRNNPDWSLVLRYITYSMELWSCDELQIDCEKAPEKLVSVAWVKIFFFFWSN